MKSLAVSAALWVVGLSIATNPSLAQDQRVVEFEITPAVQQELEHWKTLAADWAADPKVVSAVREANAKGPMPGMDNSQWKQLPKTSKEVLVLQMNDCAKDLVARMKESKGAVSEVFLNGDQGDKVAFAEKTSSYIHAGKSKFDVPFQKHMAWQGEPEADKSTMTYQIQISVPVFEPNATETTAIGALVLGIDLSHLSHIAASPQG